MAQRKIIHADCDSFYASVEMRDDPSLRGKPIAVGGSADKRGVVATCSYEARRYGVRSAMPMGEAIRLCPDLIVVRTNMSKYKAVSAQVQEIFRDYTHLVEPLSLDEAFLDVSDCEQHDGSATRIAEAIRGRVRSELGITISAGIAPNKFIAKVASDWNKPDGQLTVAPEEVEDFVRSLPVNKLFGVGSVTAKKMHNAGIRLCADLEALGAAELSRRFGKFGVRLWDLCRGIDDRPVRTDRRRKSVSVERTYAEDRPNLAACERELEHLFPELLERVSRAECAGRVRSLTVKMRFAGFETTTVTRQGKAPRLSAYRDMLKQAWLRGERPVRLIGLGVAVASEEANRQLTLFGEEFGDDFPELVKAAVSES